MHQFWKPWATLEASLEVLRILKEGYTIAFWNQPTLIRSTIIILISVTHAKECSRKGKKSSISGLFQQIFPGFQTQHEIKTYPGSELLKSGLFQQIFPGFQTQHQIKTYPGSEFLKLKFKMETPESIRISLLTGSSG